jgi:hypothetical protein
VRYPSHRPLMCVPTKAWCQKNLPENQVPSVVIQVPAYLLEEGTGHVDTQVRAGDLDGLPTGTLYRQPTSLCLLTSISPPAHRLKISWISSSTVSSSARPRERDTPGERRAAICSSHLHKTSTGPPPCTSSLVAFSGWILGMSGKQFSTWYESSSEHFIAAFLSSPVVPEEDSHTKLWQCRWLLDLTGGGGACARAR